MPGGLHDALLVALRDNPSCSITLDDALDANGKIRPVSNARSAEACSSALNVVVVVVIGGAGLFGSVSIW